MVVRVQLRVVAGRVAEALKRQVGDHLVGVHVGRGAGTALDHVDDEVLVVAAGDDLVTGRGDGGGAGGVERAELAVGERGRLLDHGERPHELGEMRERHAGDREVLERPRGMDAPDRLPRQLLRPERVGFGSEIGHGAVVSYRRRSAPREHGAQAAQHAATGLELGLQDVLVRPVRPHDRPGPADDRGNARRVEEAGLGAVADRGQRGLAGEPLHEARRASRSSGGGSAG